MPPPINLNRPTQPLGPGPHPGFPFGPGAGGAGVGVGGGGPGGRGAPGGSGPHGDGGPGGGGAGPKEPGGDVAGVAGQKRPFADISNEQSALPQQPVLDMDHVLENESSKIDIKEDGFYAGPYKQERMLNFDVERQIEEAELKEELTVGDRTSNTGMCIW